jgi:bromodomain-containing factor 1
MKTRRGQETTKKFNIESAKNLIKYLIEQDESIDFLYPVDSDKLGIPSYKKIITHPMDISTIRTKIKNRKYETIEDTIKDIQLIWNNCRTFNEKDSVKII